MGEKLITIEETLKASDIQTALGAAPFLIYATLFEAPRRPLVFLAACGEDRSLIGAVGNQIRFMTASHLSASEDTEGDIDTSGMSAANKSFSNAYVTVDTVIYSAVTLSDILLEDYPNIAWLQKMIGNMGTAVLEKLDANVKDVFVAGGTGVKTVSSGDLAYGDVIDALATMENSNWIADDVNAPMLIVAPDVAGALMKDTLFVDARRYTAYEVSKMVEGEIGMFAGCRVLKTSLLDGTGYAFIVFPPESKYGPCALIAWKRPLTVKNEYEATKAYSYYVTSIRAKAVVTQAGGIGVITISDSP